MKTNNYKIISAFIGLLLSDSCAQDISSIPQAKIGLRLLDEKNTPVANYPCGIGLYTFSGKDLKMTFISHDGKTNIKGEYWAEGAALPNMGAGLGFSHEGYYTSRRIVEFLKIEEGKLLPFGIVCDLLIKRIGQPVPMYALANLAIELPDKEGRFGYDLEKRDWIVPQGTGVKADLIFAQEKKEHAVLGSTAALSISFSNPGDGLIPLYELQGAESELKLPRTAPTEGFVNERKLTATWSVDGPTKQAIKPALGYIYRVRTVLDESGKVISAWYGKIEGEFEWEARYVATAQIKFTYYLNPDRTTNLEFDRKKNLFKDLKLGNIVQRP